MHFYYSRLLLLQSLLILFCIRVFSTVLFMYHWRPSLPKSSKRPVCYGQLVKVHSQDHIGGHNFIVAAACSPAYEGETQEASDSCVQPQLENKRHHPYQYTDHFDLTYRADHCTHQ